MKKVALFLALTVLFSCLLPLAAHAEEQPKTLLEVLAEQSADEREIFDGCEFISSNTVLITAYYYELWNFNNEVDTSITELIESAKAKQTGDECFAIDQDQVRHLSKEMQQDGSETAEFTCIKEYTIADMPNYLVDMINGRASQIICGTKCNVRDVICFPLNGLPHSNEESAIFYMTDQGNFVRIYRGTTYQTHYTMLEMTESDFFEQLALFYEHEKELHAELGDRYGAGDSFLTFVEYEGLYIRVLPEKAEDNDNNDASPEPNIFQKYLALWIAIPCVLVLAGGVTAFFLVRKKKKPAEQ